MVPVAIVAVPVMVISRTVVVARVDAERAIHAADRTAYGAADDPSDGASDGTAFGRAALHSAENALSMSGDWRGEQRCDHGYSKFLPHRYSLVPGYRFSPLNPESLRVSSTGGARQSRATLKTAPAQSEQSFCCL